MTAVARVATVDTVACAAGRPGPADAAGPRHWAAGRLWPCAGRRLGRALLAFALAPPRGPQRRSLLGGLGIGAMVVGVWWVSGRLGHLAEHPVTLEEVFLATNTRAWSR
jgi:hypothetical protein